jgi:hypothetical protein
VVHQLAKAIWCGEAADTADVSLSHVLLLLLIGLSIYTDGTSGARFFDKIMADTAARVLWQEMAALLTSLLCLSKLPK